ncbi:putative immunity protein [Subtercola boreus]|uniref:putative immunity protein n=1 Tax=Subtercola boreus TaxID=120213 RepID=UPI0011C02EFA|nr:hypothetical protein [Subtercola boreus]
MSEEPKEKWANPALPIHHAIAEWSAACAERALPIFEELRAGDDRPRAAIDALRAWVCGEMTMTACRTAAFAAHAAARDAAQAGKPAAVAAARSAGQAVAVAHMFDHSSHAADYAAKAVGILRGNPARDAERTWQWEHLDPELHLIGFPKDRDRQTSDENLSGIPSAASAVHRPPS